MKNLREIEKRFQLELNKRKEESSLRTLKLVEDKIDFCSNDYLGFAADLNSSSNSGGSTGARLISGNTLYCEELETKIAKFHHAEVGLIYNTGYMANLGVLSCLPRKGDTTIYDKLVHASIRDGMRLSNANAHSFRHNDLLALEKKLKGSRGVVFVVVESIYSMDGDMADLVSIVKLCQKYKAELIVDEAHSTGIIGEKGEGVVSQLGLENDVLARIHTFGKAMGRHGAIVMGSQLLKDYLINFSRPFIYTTAMPIKALEHINGAYDKLSNDVGNMLYIRSISNMFKQKLKAIEGIELIPSKSPIQSIIIPGNEQVIAVAKEINKDGFDVRPILSPTVEKGRERLRICLHSFNSDEEVIGLIKSIEKALIK